MQTVHNTVTQHYRSIILLLSSQLSVSDVSGRLIWTPYLRLAGRGLGVVDTRYGVKCAGWLGVVVARKADLNWRL